MIFLFSSERDEKRIKSNCLIKNVFFRKILQKIFKFIFFGLNLENPEIKQIVVSITRSIRLFRFTNSYKTIKKNIYRNESLATGGNMNDGSFRFTNV